MTLVSSLSAPGSCASGRMPSRSSLDNYCCHLSSPGPKSHAKSSVPGGVVGKQPSRSKLEMCGRYALYGPASRIREQFDLDGEFDFTPRHNIAPTTPALIVCPGSDGSRVGLLCRWGLIPRWARDVNTGTTLINARGETVAEKPAFRTAFRRGRCLVPANGFYEWKAVQEGGRLIKQPYYVRAPDERNLFAFAGLSERWVSAAGDEIHSCCIITTAANALMAPIHDRMPVIVGANDYAAWPVSYTHLDVYKRQASTHGPSRPCCRRRTRDCQARRERAG